MRGWEGTTGVCVDTNIPYFQTFGRKVINTASVFYRITHDYENLLRFQFFNASKVNRIFINARKNEKKYTKSPIFSGKSSVCIRNTGKPK